MFLCFGGRLCSVKLVLVHVYSSTGNVLLLAASFLRLFCGVTAAVAASGFEAAG